MSFPRILLSCYLLASASFPALGATWNPPVAGNAEQHLRLYNLGRTYLKANFDPDANLVGSPTNNPPNKKTHSIGASMSYVNALLMTGDENDRLRAQAVLKRVLATQDTKPDSPTSGCFARNAEDPQPDPDTAEFIGLGLASVIERDKIHPCLDPDLRSQSEQAFRLAVDAVMRRDVNPGTTNIALVSVAVAAAGQKLFSIPKTDTFAQAKLDAVMALAGDNGEFSEYLSPTAYGVDLAGAYAARHFSFSDAFAAKADALIGRLWKQIAADYHAPTYQLAGPFVRSYGDNMLNYAAGLKYWLYLALDGGYPLPDTELDHEWDKAGLVAMAEVPVSPRPEFKEATVPWRQWDVATSGSSLVRHFSQFRDGNFILSTVDVQDGWKLKRNLAAFWRNDGPPPTNVSVGYCIDESNDSLPDGAPFGQIHFYSQQKGGAALVALVTAADPPATGGCALIFDTNATVSDNKATPLTLKDGTMTAYLYPVSTGTPQFGMASDEHKITVSRAWTTADTVGSRHVLAYLIVFRPSDQTAPTVSDLTLEADGDNVSATAKVDGTNFSLSSMK